MSPALPQLSGAEVGRALGRAGFEQVPQRGSHVKVRHPDGRMAIVRLHRDLAPGTLRSILRQAGISADQVRELL